jgi:hypothetical protein
VYQPFDCATKNPVWSVFGVQSSARRTASAGGGVPDADGEGAAEADSDGDADADSVGASEADGSAVGSAVAVAGTDGLAAADGVAGAAVAGAAVGAGVTAPPDGAAALLHAASTLVSRRSAGSALRARTADRGPGGSCCVTVDSIASEVRKNAVPGTQDGGESMGLLPSLV